MQDNGHAWVRQAHAAAAAHGRAHPCDGDGGESDRRTHRSRRWRKTCREDAESAARVKGIETIYGLHAVRAMLARASGARARVKFAERARRSAHARNRGARARSTARAAHRRACSQADARATSLTRASSPKSSRCRRGPRTICIAALETAKTAACWCSTACRTRTTSAPACAPRMPAERSPLSCRRIGRRSSMPLSARSPSARRKRRRSSPSRIWCATLKLLKEAGLWVVGADAEGAKLAHEVDLKGGVALVLGAEGSGLRQLTRQTCDWWCGCPSWARSRA